LREDILRAAQLLHGSLQLGRAGLISPQLLGLTHHTPPQ
jgi:hypothetical protein